MIKSAFFTLLALGAGVVRRHNRITRQRSRELSSRPIPSSTTSTRSPVPFSTSRTFRSKVSSTTAACGIGRATAKALRSTSRDANILVEDNAVPAHRGGWPTEAPYTEFIDAVVDAYAKSYANLKVHDPNYPAPAALKSKIQMGQCRF